MRADDEHGHLRLDGAANVRDMGGLPVAGGAIVPGRLLRGDALNSLTPGDVARLAGLRTVLDFRTEGEIALNGADRLPPGAVHRSLPVGGGVLAPFYKVVSDGDTERQREVFGGGRIADRLRRANTDYVADPAQRATFATALRAVAADGPLLFHCTGGKDRTGWMAAIVLRALGAAQDTVMADYMRSNVYNKPGYDRLLDNLRASGQMEDPELLRPLLQQDPSYMEAAFTEVGARFGTFDAFLAKGLDADDALLTRLRATLVG